MKVKCANEQKQALVSVKQGQTSLTIRATYHTDLSGHQVTQSVEPVDVGLQVTGFTLPEETLKNKRGKMTWLKYKHDRDTFCVFLVVSCHVSFSSSLF